MSSLFLRWELCDNHDGRNSGQYGLATMSDERALALSKKFDEFVRPQATFRELFGLI